MTQTTHKIFVKEVSSKGAKGNYITNKSYVFHNDDIWSLDILDLKDFGPENSRGYRYVLPIIDIFLKPGWTTLVKHGKKFKR